MYSYNIGLAPTCPLKRSRLTHDVGFKEAQAHAYTWSVRVISCSAARRDLTHIYYPLSTSCVDCCVFSPGAGRKRNNLSKGGPPTRVGPPWYRRLGRMKNPRKRCVHACCTPVTFNLTLPTTFKDKPKRQSMHGTMSTSHEYSILRYLAKPTGIYGREACRD